MRFDRVSLWRADPAAAHSARMATRFTAVPKAKFAERIMFKLRPTNSNSRGKALVSPKIFLARAFSCACASASCLGVIFGLLAITTSGDPLPP
eukprot:Skav216309  [mRNA]  locus=scaffold494:231405:233768:+ [translate_table: standard]